MSRGVGIATDNRHAWQREPLFRPDDVDDAVVLIHHAIVCQSEVSGISGECIHLFLRYGVLDGLVLIMSGCIMIRHTENLPGTETLQTTSPHTIESLRRGHFVTIQPVDI